MLYVGQFRDRYEKQWQVRIITNNSTTQTTELILSGNPVTITQVSDGLFSPIKSRGCTITLVTNEAYTDIFSSTSHGTQVEVNNLTDAVCVFKGYVTPCQYNQPYTYLDEVEVECVDALSTLQDFRFEYQNNKAEVRSIKQIVLNCLAKSGISNSGHVYVQYDANCSADNVDQGRANNKAWPPFWNEFINEEAFFENNEDHDALSCYEVLEEICKFYNMSLIPYGDDVYFVDYNTIITYDKEHSGSGWTNVATTTLKFSDLRTGNSNTPPTRADIDIPRTIQKDDYAGEDQNIEYDEVYNKVSVESDSYDVDKDLILEDPFEPEDPKRAADWTDTMNCSNGEQWTCFNQAFYFPHGNNGGFGDSKSLWSHTFLSCFNAWSSTPSSSTPVPVSHSYYHNYNAPDLQYMPIGIYNTIGCVFARQFGFKSSDAIPTKASWDKVLICTTGMLMVDRALKALGTNAGVDSEYNWENIFWQKYLGGNYPILTYSSDKNVMYSTPFSNLTTYIVITAQTMYQFNTTVDGVKYHPNSFENAYKDFTYETSSGWNGNILGSPITYHGIRTAEAVKKRSSSDTFYNKGWPMLKCRLCIGDSTQKKYWNGSSWVSNETTFWINMHKAKVANKDEELVISGWNTVASNYDYTSMIDIDNGLAIPIKSTDMVSGYLTFDLYPPRTPYNVWGVSRNNQDLFGHNLYKSGNTTRINLPGVSHLVFIKDFGIQMKTIDTSKSFIDAVFKNKDNDDVIYTNNINNANVVEMDDLKLKVTCTNRLKPVAYSHIITPMYSFGYAQTGGDKYTNKFYNYYTTGRQEQEKNVLEAYYRHYSSPKLIYNATVHGYFMPYECVTATATGNARMIVDEQQWNVKDDINEVKLIEV